MQIAFYSIHLLIFTVMLFNVEELPLSAKYKFFVYLIFLSMVLFSLAGILNGVSHELN